MSFLETCTGLNSELAAAKTCAALFASEPQRLRLQGWTQPDAPLAHLGNRGTDVNRKTLFFGSNQDSDGASDGKPWSRA